MRNRLLIVLLAITLGSSQAQNVRYFTRSGEVNFNATAPSSPEKIEAKNDKASCVIDINTSQVEMAVLIKAFTFERALMEEHFNENYMESDKFPKAIFKGEVKDIGSIDLKKDGTYKIIASGKLTIHGITKEVETPVTISVKNNNLNAKFSFSVFLADYGISIPSLVKDKVGKEAKIDANINLQPLSSTP